MATKSSKIAVTLQPSLKQKLREYGKENQIKNFSGVILAILDEYFGSSDSASSSSAPSSDVMALIQELTTRVAKLESGATATTSTAAPEKPKKPAKPKVTTRKSTTATKAAAKPKPKAATKTTTRKTAKTEKPAKPVKKTATKAAAPKTKAKTTRSTKASSKATSAKSSKAAPVKKGKGSGNQWMSTREAFNMYGGDLSWSRFSKLTPEELKERFNLDSDLTRKVRGSRFNQWLKAGK